MSKEKTCGDCRHFDGRYNLCAVTSDFCTVEPDYSACDDFEQKPKPTNGDRIRQMSNERLAGFIYSRVECIGGALGLADCPGDQMDCFKCWEIWLNAPVES